MGNGYHTYISSWQWHAGGDMQAMWVPHVHQLPNPLTYMSLCDSLIRFLVKSSDLLPTAEEYNYPLLQGMGNGYHMHIKYHIHLLTLKHVILRLSDKIFIRSSFLHVLPTMEEFQYTLITRNGKWVSHLHLRSTTCTPHGCHMYNTWVSHVHNMGVTCTPHGCHMYTSWVSHVHHMGVTCTPHGCHMHTTWVSQVYQILYTYTLASVILRADKILCTAVWPTAHNGREFNHPPITSDGNDMRSVKSIGKLKNYKQVTGHNYVGNT